VSALPVIHPGSFDPASRWTLNPRVSVRPERFGALLYHFGTRRLSFLKDRRLLQVISSLDDHPSALAACAAAGVTPGEQPDFTAALRRLADSDMIVRPPKRSCDENPPAGFPPR
jgi:putative mycofactocin binding protein MftB